MRKKLDIAGQTFTNVLVLEEHPVRSHGKVKWVCQCLLCGGTFITIGSALKSNRITSCCAQWKPTHNMSNSRPYKIWQSMKNRCFNKNCKEYLHYGGRGITICEDWLSFDKFWEDMRETYTDVLSIDRIDVDGNYCKQNCRWATNSQQALNKRKSPGKSSQYRNVYYSKADDRWCASIVIPHKQLKYIGGYHTELEAALAVDEYIRKHNLPHHLNFKEQ